MQQNARHWPQYLGAFAVLILLAGVASASAALLQLQKVTNTFNELSVDIDKAAKDELADAQDRTARKAAEVADLERKT